jgi:hypothetical protein
MALPHEALLLALCLAGQGVSIGSVVVTITVTDATGAAASHSVTVAVADVPRLEGNFAPLATTFGFAAPPFVVNLAGGTGTGAVDVSVSSDDTAILPANQASVTPINATHWRVALGVMSTGTGTVHATITARDFLGARSSRARTVTVGGAVLVLRLRFFGETHWCCRSFCCSCSRGGSAAEPADGPLPQ